MYKLNRKPFMDIHTYIHAYIHTYKHNLRLRPADYEPHAKLFGDHRCWKCTADQDMARPFFKDWIAYYLV